MQKLQKHQVVSELTSLTGWQHNEQAEEIFKEYQFKGFLSAMSFVNSVAFLANQINHHPDIEIRFNKVLIKLTTHDVKGLSSLDFELAQKIEKLISGM